MKYTKNYQFKKPDADDAYDIQNENDNMDLIDETLKNTVDNVDIELNAALEELRIAIANATAILESAVDSKIGTHTGDTNNPHKVTLAQVLGGGGSSVIPVTNGGTGNSSVDTTPTQNSTKMVTSGGVYAALQNLTPASHKHNASDITSGTLGVARGGTGRSSKTTSSSEYEFRAIKVQSTIPTSVDTGCIVLVV
ncbi:MAG: hypothetical protein IKP66_05495 [Lachnospiraceae bacterium]|nr:hypothetical protein [Lachnospiraceae bacterium]